jgi:hypothetical protein
VPNDVPSKPVIAALLACVLLVASASMAADQRGSKADPDDETHFLDTELDQFAADADADPFAGPVPLTVRFTTHTINAQGRLTYAWNFDDGARSSEQNPVHTFRKRGWYFVTMDVRDQAGHTYRINLQLHAWRVRDWERYQTTRDARIVNHAVRELERKRQRQKTAVTGAAPATP